MKYIIDGLDFLGKSTLIANLIDTLGYHEVIHFQKPKSLTFYKNSTSLGHLITPNFELKQYQYASFNNAFKLLTTPNVDLIMDRCHLGECVYAPLYRNYSGDYVFELEQLRGFYEEPDIKLILLTEDFSKSKHFKDDGESFDISKRQQEQEMFIAAFNKSCLQNKKMVCVTGEDGQFKDQQEILNEVLGNGLVNFYK